MRAVRFNSLEFGEIEKGGIPSDRNPARPVPSPAGDPFGHDARTGPVGFGPVRGADARRTDAARARPRPLALVTEPWRVPMEAPARPAREPPDLHVSRRDRNPA